jgi:hypothetical protein
MGGNRYASFSPSLVIETPSLGGHRLLKQSNLLLFSWKIRSLFRREAQPLDVVGVNVFPHVELTPDDAKAKLKAAFDKGDDP